MENMNLRDQLQKISGGADLPSGLLQLAGDLPASKITKGHRSGDLVYSIDDRYILKITDRPGNLLAEKRANDYLQGRLAASQSVFYQEVDGRAYYLKTKVHGDSLISKACLADPERIADVMSDAARAIHGLDARDCTFRCPDCPDGDIFVHGDFCLPNILADGNAFAALIDTGTCGLGDPWVDYAWCIWSFEYNLKTKACTPMLLDKLGICFDQERYSRYVPY